MITNYERIKNMSIDEMAEYLSNRAGCCYCVYEFTECNSAVGCIQGITQWLSQEVEE